MKKILIIGSGPGLSAAVARRFGRDGWRVVLVARNAERLDREIEALAAEGIVARGVAADAADLAEMDAMVRREDASEGGIDLLCYNAASVRNQPLLDQPLETIASDLLCGIGGGIVAARAVIPGMAARGGGSILFTGGSLGVTAWHDWAVLGACKAALRNLAEALSKDPACESIYVGNVIISEFISQEVAAEIANLYYDLHRQGKTNASWDTAYVSGQGAGHG